MGLIHKFLALVDSSPKGCWEWMGSYTGSGYGQFWIEGKQHGAHRVMWRWITGRWAEVVMHKCDNPRCVRPDHLKEGTHKNNSRDMVAKGRQKSGFSGHHEWRKNWKPPGRKGARRDSRGRFTTED